MKYDFDDILIKPVEFSNIKSRNEINIKDSKNYLPLFTAPMDTVVCDENIKIFEEHNIYPIIPRTSKKEFIDNKYWHAYSLEQYSDIFLNKKQNIKNSHYALIDVANGHMDVLLDIVKKTNDIYNGQINLMIGNIANPDTVFNYVKENVWGIRCGIGAGNGCLTTQQTGVGYPMASLIKESREIIDSLFLDTRKTKIIADGGFKKYSDIIKAIALGSDYVMLGGILNKALESAGYTYLPGKKHNGFIGEDKKVNQFLKTTKDFFNNGHEMNKRFRGMSTKEVQKSLGVKNPKTSEGISKINKVEYTLEGWIENFSHYLKSAMSYTNCMTLDEFIGKVEVIHITNNAYNRFNK